MYMENNHENDAFRLLSLQAEILEMIATGSALVEVLNQLCTHSEKIVGQCVGSVMVYNHERTHLHVIAAPTMPTAAVEALNGLVPGEGAGSCANAVLHSKPAFVSDVVIDERWCKVRHLAEQYHIGACWSFPVFIHGRVTGSFAITSFSKRHPGALHQQLLKTAAHLAGIAIERARNDETLRHSNTAFDNTSEAILVADLHGMVFRYNPAYRRMSGFDDEDIRQGNLFKLLLDDPYLVERTRQQLLSNGSWRGEVQARKKNGDRFPALLNLSSICDEQQRRQYVAVLSDISLLKASEKRLTYLAHHDTLTELPNRFAFEKLLDNSIRRQCSENTPLALLFIDLDNFKTINDARGHAAGDKLLQQVAARLCDCVRDSDIVARVGGDEFTVLLPYTNIETVKSTAQRILEKLAELYCIDDNDYYSSASIGIALAPSDGQDIDTLIRAADTAMYKAKKLGKDQYCFYTRKLTEKMCARMDMEVCLRQAIDRHELFIEYQPQYDTDRKIIALEALLRWDSPRFGRVPPSQFIAVAEESGLIADIGNWVLENACLQTGALLRHSPDIKISVNLSRYQLKRFFTGSLAAILQDTGFDASRLEIEITESTMLREMKRNRKLLRDVTEMGITLSIDDFGTGYSSLSDLKHLPVQALKIDRSLIDGLPEDSAITKAVLAMGEALGLNVVAEGVETREQLDTLVESGCRRFQGFLFSRPLSLKQAIESLENGQQEANPV